MNYTNYSRFFAVLYQYFEFYMYVILKTDIKCIRKRTAFNMIYKCEINLIACIDIFQTVPYS